MIARYGGGLAELVVEGDSTRDDVFIIIVLPNIIF